MLNVVLITLITSVKDCSDRDMSDIRLLHGEIYRTNRQTLNSPLILPERVYFEHSILAT